ncbi:MBL fold metallo-hydrolase [Peptacetobacter hominis]|uniref:MBL fold metallo-hydrolase n=1 Tax=Peptacetobacter hominis TaxID=2743610 RepID=A0A544QTA5_9FIRM|nr:ComEC/Rec2 family competence protein [Peptacetobacter hominis]TQQ83915.1 MBL fold metallo-hydrolase [Peptacetobacter hominis]
MIKNSIKILLTSLLSITLLLSGCSSDKEDLSDYDKLDSSYSTTSDKINDSETGKAEIHFIDTGNSDAILIKEGSDAMLIDAGDNDDEDRIVDYLNNNGVEELKYVIATHAHADHIGGLDSVIENIKVDRVFISNGDSETKTYRDFVNAMAEKNLDPSVPLENKKFYLGKSYFEVFNTNGGSDTNNESLVILYTCGNSKTLLMGDAEKEVEYEIINKMPDVDILKLGHHGSSTSTTEAFLDKVNPEYTVILCGKNNDYGHPHKETIEKLKKRNLKPYRTDECGNIVFYINEDGIQTDSIPGDYLTGNKDETESNTSNSGSIVYWTKNGKVYHSNKNCDGLKNSKSINSGTIEDSGKERLCKICEKNK